MAKLRATAKELNKNLDVLIEENPGVDASPAIRFFESQFQERALKNVSVASEFLDLLINYNPAPWDIPGGGMSSYFEGIWKTVHPFKDSTILECDPENLKYALLMPSLDLEYIGFHPEKFVSPESQVDITDRTLYIRQHRNKEYVQGWLNGHHLKFIDEYVSLARQPAFSYGQIWELKLKYLDQLYEFVKETSAKEKADKEVYNAKLKAAEEAQLDKDAAEKAKVAAEEQARILEKEVAEARDAAQKAATKAADAKPKPKEERR